MLREIRYAWEEDPLNADCIVLYPESLLFFGVCGDATKEGATVEMVGVIDPTGVIMADVESTEAAESKEFIDIVDLALFLRLGEDTPSLP
jgi:hypothetical protein